MKCKVIKEFVDRYTKKDCAVGQVIEIKADRAKELEGYVEKTSAKTEKK